MVNERAPIFILPVPGWFFLPPSAPSGIQMWHFHMLGLSSYINSTAEQQQALLCYEATQDCWFCPTVAILDTMGRAAMPSGAESSIATHSSISASQ